MFLRLLDPDPLVRGTVSDLALDPSLSEIMLASLTQLVQKLKFKTEYNVPVGKL